jgi:hypothetical protein
MKDTGIVNVLWFLRDSVREIKGRVEHRLQQVPSVVVAVITDVTNIVLKPLMVL